MKALKNILIAVVALGALFIVVGLFLPNTWEVSKSVTISASKERIYDSVANLTKWPEWSPWNDTKDTSLKYTYEGAEFGEGAQQNWTSNKMGTGWLKITKANPETGISYDLFIDMGRIKSNLQGEIAFESVEGQTKVTWIDRGQNKNIFEKWMALSMGSMLGKDMLLGLNNLKAIVEKAEVVEEVKEEPTADNAAPVEEAAAEATPEAAKEAEAEAAPAEKVEEEEAKS
jgi:hypothetical protein